MRVNVFVKRDVPVVEDDVSKVRIEHNGIQLDIKKDIYSDDLVIQADEAIIIVPRASNMFAIRYRGD